MGRIAGDCVCDCVSSLKERRGRGSSGCRRRQRMGRVRWARKGIGDGVGSARSVGGRDGKLGDEGQLALLMASFRRGKAMECRKERFVVSEQEKGEALQDGRMNHQQLLVKGGVMALSRGKLGGAEDKREPVAILPLLKDRTNVEVRGV